MNAVDIDVRRYAWCQGQALWIMGMPIGGFVEDLEGALAAGQVGLARRVARLIGDACAVVVNLVELNRRPIPPPTQRTMWALEGLEGHRLWEDCWILTVSGDDEPIDTTVERCRRLVAAVQAMVGEVPDVLTPEGYFPALALARDWLKLLEAVGEQGFLPKDWTQG